MTRTEATAAVRRKTLLAAILVLGSAVADAQYQLSVTIEPGAAITAGAQWSVTSGEWHNSGEYVNLATATCNVSFTTLGGWQSPAPPLLGLALEQNALTRAMGTYTRLASFLAPQMSYRGRLTDASGNPLGGNLTRRDLLFRIWDDPVSTDLNHEIWTETHSNVPIVNGEFNVILGTAGFLFPLNHDLGQIVKYREQYLSVTLSALNLREIMPRQRIFSAPQALNGVPPGVIEAFGGVDEVIPHGWLLCDGRQLDAWEYPSLFGAIGYVWGGSGRYFNLPDLRGRFLRGISGDSPLANTIDPDRNSRTASNRGGNAGNLVGSVQGDATRRPRTGTLVTPDASHTHRVNGSTTSGGTGLQAKDNQQLAWQSGVTGEQPAHSHTITGGGDHESRPVNWSVNWIIKY